MRYLIILLFYAFSIQSYAKTIRVAVIDTGFSTVYNDKVKFCEDSIYDFTGYGIKDVVGHGTNIAGLIVENNEKIDYCLIILKFMHQSSALNIGFYFKALEKVVELKPDIVNLSLGGPGFYRFEAQSIKTLLDNGIQVVAAAGNEGINLNIKCFFYPACLDSRIHVIGNKSATSNYGRVVDEIIDGNNKTALGFTASGSSQSTAIFTQRLIRKLYNEQKNKN